MMATVVCNLVVVVVVVVAVIPKADAESSLN